MKSNQKTLTTRQWQRRAREHDVNALENGLSHSLDLDYPIDVSAAQLQQVLGNGRACQGVVKELAVKVEPRAAHQPRDGRSASVVRQQSRLNSRHEQSGQLNSARRHQRQLQILQVLVVHQLG